MLLKQLSQGFRKPGMFSLKYQVFAYWSKQYKSQQPDKQPLPRSIHRALGFHNAICIDMLVATLFLKLVLPISCNPFLSPVCFTRISAVLLPWSKERQSVVSLPHPLIPFIQFLGRVRRSVSTVCRCLYVKVVENNSSTWKQKPTMVAPNCLTDREGRQRETFNFIFAVFHFDVLFNL